MHIYDCGGFIKKLDENTGTVLRTLNIGSALDWEAVPYDPVNDIVLIASQNDHSLSAVYDPVPEVGEAARRAIARLAGASRFAAV